MLIRKTMASMLLFSLTMGGILGCTSEPSVVDQLDPTTKAILNDPAFLESFRVDPETIIPTKDHSIGKFTIIAQGPRLDREAARALAKILQGKEIRQSIKKCGFHPGVAFQIVDAKGNSVDTLFCFLCDVMQLGGSDWQDFDLARGKVLRLAKRAFPDDPEIQGLKESRR